MKRILILNTFIFFTVMSCADNNKDKATTNDIGIDSTNKSLRQAVSNSLTSDTLIVDREAAVFVMPDSLRIQKRKKEIGEENFQIGMDDYAFYMNSADKFLDSVKMIMLDTKSKNFIVFIHSDKTREVVKLDTLDELWTIYFFEPTKKAKEIDMTIIDEEYKSYFK